ncbi:hypothetical protein V5799_023088 [Amblyomma americanum]|uniref:Uncharacterized protein n=1 Tax=Amblyomma americanum TaxID=6943 RepID=A0AAQ4FJA4_AMBAM
MSMVMRKWDYFSKNRHQFFSTFVTSDDAARLDVKDETYVPFITDNFGDWTDDIAVALGSDVLRRCIGYPAERVRLRLYKTWLANFAAQEWPDTFDRDLLESIVATPSPSDPTKPLFGDLFRQAAVRPRPEGTYLDTSALSPLFKRPAVLDADFKTAKGLVAYLDGLLSVGDREALHEAGLIIGFLSLLLSSVSAVSVNRLIGIFRDLEKFGLAAVLPTSFSGEFPCPTSANLENLRDKCGWGQSALRPYIPALAVAQYTLFMRAIDEAPKEDVLFLGQSFMVHTKYSGLDCVDLLEMFAKRTRFPMDYLNLLLGGNASAWTRKLMEFYLSNVASPGNTQKSAPWCRVVDPTFFRGLEVGDGRSYALKIMCFLARSQRGLLYRKWSRLANETMSESEVEDARVWADNIRALLAKGKLRPVEASRASATN